MRVSRSQARRWLATITFASTFAWGSACFTGEDALGLPCEQDDDCGRGQACEAGFCGGPPPTTGATDTTTEGPTTSTTDPATDSGSDSGSSGSTGLPPGCGNGIVEDGEDCDDEGESADCNADCTPAMCGDGKLNVSAGEECDPEGGFDFQCIEGCDAVLFYDDMSDALASEGEWGRSLPAVDGLMLAGDAQWVLDGEAWRTGEYSCDPGAADLVSGFFALDPPPDGQHIELRFRHRYHFDPDPGLTPACNGVSARDGGVVFVVVDGSDTKLAGIYPGQGLEAAGSCPDMDNPLGVGEAFARQSGPGFSEVVVSLETFEAEGAQGQLRFRAGYDCANCGHDCVGAEPPPDEYGWWIDEIRVEYVGDEP